MQMTFGELVKYVRQRLNIENNQSIQDSELRQMINLSLATLDEILVTEYEDYHLKNYLATLSASSSGNINNRIPLPPDFFKLRGVDYGSSGQWITIYGFNFQQRNYYNNNYGVMYAPYGNQVARKARVVDQYIMVEPQTMCSGQYQIWYTPQFKPFATCGRDDCCLLPYDMSTQSFVEYAVAATGDKVYGKLLLPEAQVEMKGQMAYYEDKVRNSGKNRMSNGPQTMTNVRNRGRGWGINNGGFGL